VGYLLFPLHRKARLGGLFCFALGADTGPHESLRLAVALRATRSTEAFASRHKKTRCLRVFAFADPASLR
jgi:hypothetical protein